MAYLSCPEADASYLLASKSGENGLSQTQANSAAPLRAAITVPPAMPADLSDELHNLVLSQLDDDQAMEVVSIPLEGKSSVADYMVIASGTSDRHVKSVAQNLVETMKRAGQRPLGVEGDNDGEWVLVDLQDALVHVMLPRVREFYNLEKLWDIPPGMAREQDDG